MGLKRNILANYASQIYVMVVGIVMVPLYIEYMGAEAYGLVGFFAMLQTWFQLLDIGLTPTMAREMARFQGGATDALSLRRFIGDFLVRLRACPQCGTKGGLERHRIVTSHATSFSDGHGQQITTCAHCSYRHEESYTISHKSDRSRGGGKDC